MRLNNITLIKIKYKFRLFFTKVMLKIGWSKHMLANRYGERILLFHGIDKVNETKYNSRFVSIDYFEKLIKHITENYNVISIDDYYQKKFKSNTLNIAITFDDGYLNNYLYAIPILKKYNVPASFYITTIHNKAEYLWPDFIDLVSYYTDKQEVLFEQNIYHKNHKNEFLYQGNSLKNVAKTIPYSMIELLYPVFMEDWNNLPKENLNEYWKLMSPLHIKSIADDSLFSIGAHSETHVNLSAIHIKEAKEDILNNKKQLEHICGHNISEFAFPFGYYNAELVQFCEEIGYDKILLVDYNSKTDRKNKALKNRFVINPYISLQEQLVYLLRGIYY